MAPKVVEKRTYLSPTCFTFTKKEKCVLCQYLFDVKVSDGYSSNIRALVDMKEFKLVGLKSHDCHTLIQHLLYIATIQSCPKMFDMLLQDCACFLTRYVAR